MDKNISGVCTSQSIDPIGTKRYYLNPTESLSFDHYKIGNVSMTQFLRAVVPVRVIINIIITVSSKNIFFYLFIFSFPTFVCEINLNLFILNGPKRAGLSLALRHKFLK